MYFKISVLVLFVYEAFFSHMGDMSDEQQKTLEDFKKYLNESQAANHPMYDDYYLLRFLRARKFDMEKTKLMFKNFIDWRKENDVDNVIDVKLTLA